MSDWLLQDVGPSLQAGWLQIKWHQHTGQDLTQLKPNMSTYGLDVQHANAAHLTFHNPVGLWPSHHSFSDTMMVQRVWSKPVFVCEVKLKLSPLPKNWHVTWLCRYFRMEHKRRGRREWSRAHYVEKWHPLLVQTSNVQPAESSIRLIAFATGRQWYSHRTRSCTTVISEHPSSGPRPQFSPLKSEKWPLLGRNS